MSPPVTSGYAGGSRSRAPGWWRTTTDWCGTVSFGRGGNKKLWTLRERNQPAVYVSRLILSRRHAGEGIGADLIDWAGQRGVTGWGAEWIRVDVWTSNEALQAYYKRQGFTHLRTWQFNDPWDYPSAAVFQKKTADINSVAATRFQEDKQSQGS